MGGIPNGLSPYGISTDGQRTDGLSTQGLRERVNELKKYLFSVLKLSGLLHTSPKL